jgi:ABC-type multidrug transport system fused ATPase/permease subunit
MSGKDEIDVSYGEKTTTQDVLVPAITANAISAATGPMRVETATADEAKKKKESKSNSMINFFRILRFATKTDAIAMVIASICAAGSGVALPLMTIFFGRLAGGFNDHATPGSNLSSSSFSDLFSRNSAYIVYLFIGKFVLGYVATFAFRISGIRLSATIRKTYLRNLFSQPVAALDRLPAGLATDNLGRAANTIQFAFSEKLGILVLVSTRETINTDSI